jgi:protein-S-isoprenylcysteine O-methyltransferase Ste14
MERELYSCLLIAWAGVAACAFIALQFVAAPYGRHSRPGWGPTIHRTAGWVIMESPAVAVFLVCFLLSDRRTDPVALAFLLLWLLHYVNRALIYPFRLRGGQLRMPVSVMAMGFLFNVMNGYLQGRGLFALGPARGVGWFGDQRFIVGLLLFLGGYALNRQSDAVLRGLRTPGDTGYQIPYAGAFRLVSCPNYLGELVEWLGWALLTWSPAGLAFFLWTAANLLPRARSHHRWYQERFPTYPVERKAVIPFLY